MTPRSLLGPARFAGQPLLRVQSDERLVDLARSGHAPAFEMIVHRYRRPLLRYCSRILDDQSAEDAVQQAFVNAYESMIGSGGQLELRAWLYRIAHNVALNALRDRGRGHEQLDEGYDGVERPDQAFDRRQSIRDVVAAMQALPGRQREALVLRELEGRSYEEIALELGVTGGSVRQLLNRARTTLRTGASALTPIGLLARLPLSHTQPVSDRVGEIVGGATGGGALAAKVCATVLVTGAVAGGVATAPDRDPGNVRVAGIGAEEALAGPDRDARPAASHRGPAGPPTARRVPSRATGPATLVKAHTGAGEPGRRRSSADDHRGTRSGDDDPGPRRRDSDENSSETPEDRHGSESDDEPNAGPGGEESDHSGPGSGESETGDVEPDEVGGSVDRNTEDSGTDELENEAADDSPDLPEPGSR